MTQETGLVAEAGANRISRVSPHDLARSTAEGLASAPGMDGVDRADPEADKRRTAFRRLLALVAGLLDGDVSVRQAAEDLLAALKR
jgi:hypothetical protein